MDDWPFLLVVGWIGTGLLCETWWRGVISVAPLAASRKIRLSIFLLPVVLILLLALALRKWAATDVKNDLGWLSAYSFSGMGILGGAACLLRLLGFDLRSDVLEKRNLAALWPSASAMTGATFCYIGANVGEGPGPEVVVVCALLALCSFAFLWLLCEITAHFSERITIERDLSSGIRLSALLLSVGLILGAAVAGDWVSTLETVRDFIRYGWPATLVCLAAITAEKGFVRAAHKRSLTSSIWALLLICSSLAYVYFYSGGLK